MRSTARALEKVTEALGLAIGERGLPSLRPALVVLARQLARRRVRLGQFGAHRLQSVHHGLVRLDVDRIRNAEAEDGLEPPGLVDFLPISIGPERHFLGREAVEQAVLGRVRGIDTRRVHGAVVAAFAPERVPGHDQAQAGDELGIMAADEEDVLGLDDGVRASSGKGVVPSGDELATSAHGQAEASSRTSSAVRARTISSM